MQLFYINNGDKRREIILKDYFSSEKYAINTKIHKLEGEILNINHHVLL